MGLALRLVHLGAPPLGFHAWRQADTAGVARNFAREGMNILRPRADWRGTTSGVVEMEFPAYPYLAAAAYRLVGVHEWVMRLMSALASSAAGWFLFRLVALLVNARTGAWSAALWACLPLSVYYGRSIQPEALISLCVAAGVYWTALWSRGRSAWLLLPAWAAVTLACLLKVPTLYIGLPIAVLCGQRLGWRLVLEPRLWVFAASLVAAVFAWYWHAHTLGNETGLHFMTSWGGWGEFRLLLTWSFWNRMVFALLAERHLTWAGFALFAVGVWLPRRGPGERVFDAWALAVLVFVMLLPERQRVHEYYQVPAMLGLVVFVAKVLDRFWERRRPVLIVALAGMAGFTGFRLVEYWRQENPASNPHAIVARELAGRTDPGDLVVVLDGLAGNPTVLYLADRKGWTPRWKEFDLAAWERHRREGAVAAVAVRPTFKTDEERAWLERAVRDHPPAWEGEAGVIWRIGP